MTILSTTTFLSFCILIFSIIKIVKIVKKSKLNGEKNYFVTKKRIYISLMAISFITFLIIFTILVFLALSKGG